MGKRSHFKRRPQDAYSTPYKAVLPLLPHLTKPSRFVEPCAGEGALIRHLEHHGHYCIERYDIQTGTDARSTQYGGEMGPELIITNPPWDRPILHEIIENCRNQAPTWLLIDADWKHTIQARRHLEYCSLVVPIGRVKWIPDSPHTGKDNCAWYLFGVRRCQTVFVPRMLTKQEIPSIGAEEFGLNAKAIGWRLPRVSGGPAHG